MPSNPKLKSLPNPTVGALVLDIGHSTLRAGHSEDAIPTQVWPSVVGVGEDFDIFPVCANPHSRYLRADYIKYSDTPTSPIVYNGKSYIRAVTGSFGSSRISDRRILQSLKIAKDRLNLYDIPLLSGAHWNNQDCWDTMNCNLMYNRQEPIKDLDSLTILNVVKGLNRYTNLASGLEELARGRPVLLVESNTSSMESRIYQCEQLFENLRVPGIYFGHGSQLAAYASGLSSSIIIDVGSATTSLCVMINDEVFAYKEYNVGGDVVDIIFLNLLHGIDEHHYDQIVCHPDYLLSRRPFPGIKQNKNALVSAIANRRYSRSMDAKLYSLHEGLRDFKESVLKISQTRRTDDKFTKTAYPNATFKLPDNMHLDLQYSSGHNYILSSAGEVLFEPQLVEGLHPIELGDFRGIPSAFHEIIQSNSIYRNDVFSQILVVGGGANLGGLQQRLVHELGKFTEMSPHDSVIGGAKFKIIPIGNKTQRRHASWIGGSILSNFVTLHECWISLQEYEEHGGNICNRKTSQIFG
ncbi:bifunctional Actin family/ATPase [Babesia duncani]|uniref:Bifunctional Actin family/ATPase n=1 Tax=Babesia duncani TaxID=323732 RepID=A0AAD9PML1_9APIC|nr:bifunctional Actin family/ATPase [Babesia duncani]